jgi:hypothetical protein
VPGSPLIWVMVAVPSFYNPADRPPIFDSYTPCLAGIEPYSGPIAAALKLLKGPLFRSLARDAPRPIACGFGQCSSRCAGPAGIASQFCALVNIWNARQRYCDDTRRPICHATSKMHLSFRSSARHFVAHAVRSKRNGAPQSQIGRRQTRLHLPAAVVPFADAARGSDPIRPASPRDVPGRTAQAPTALLKRVFSSCLV